MNKNSSNYNKNKQLCLVERGKRLAECRKEKNYTQEQLAESIHVCSQLISLYERGKRCFKNNVYEISKVLNVSEKYLMCDSNYKTIEEQYQAEYECLYNSDDFLIKYLKNYGYKITFISNTSSTKSEDTPSSITTLGSNITVNINGTDLKLYDFQCMLDDIKDYINFILDKKTNYINRREESYMLEFVDKISIEEKRVSGAFKTIINDCKKNNLYNDKKCIFLTEENIKKLKR